MLKNVINVKKQNIIKKKQKLLKLLSILNRYFQYISINFITLLFKYKRNNKIYQHIIITINRLFKKNIYNIKFTKNKCNNSNFHKINIKKKYYFKSIVLNKNIQFIVYF